MPGLWRHVVHRIPLRYEATLWSIVFPLGMYGVGGHCLGTPDRLPIVNAIGANQSWVALAAWALTFLAILTSLARILTSAQPFGSAPSRGSRSADTVDRHPRPHRP